MNVKLKRRTGEKIAIFRRKNGLSQAELAVELGLARSSVASWEIGKNLPSIENLIDLASILRVPADVILGCSGNTGAFFAATPSEKEMVYSFRQLSCENKKIAIAVFRSLIISDSTKNEKEK